MTDSTEYLTVVYRDVSAGHAQTFICHDKMAAASWSHAIHDRDTALAARQADEALLREVKEALELARDYVNAELLHRQEAYDGYPHKWATERADLLSVDATLSKLKERLQ